MSEKVWLITGCSSGFGRALAEELLKTKAKVVATARDLASLSYLKGDNLLRLSLDVTKPKDITNVVQEATKHFGRIDVLVNNAGYGMIGAIEECAVSAVRKMFETNFFGLMQLTQAVLPVMRKQKSGHIINMSSVAGITASPGFGMYNATKYAVEGLSEALQLEVDHFGIKVTIVEPGPFRTDFASRSLDVQPATSPYTESVGKTRDYLTSVNNAQPGDPLKAAHILIKIAESANPPLHLPLGNMSVDRIRTKAQNWEKWLTNVESISRSADFN